MNVSRKTEIQLCDSFGFRWENRDWNLLNMRLGGPQSRSRYFRETENMLKICDHYGDSNHGYCFVHRVS
jgi:hypothetical protein